MKKTFVVQNLKCDGCAKTISKALNKINGVKSIDVIPETSTIEVEIEAGLKSEIITQRLAGIGYPLVDTKNSAFQKVNSYISCMSGKLN